MLSSLQWPLVYGISNVKIPLCNYLEYEHCVYLRLPIEQIQLTSTKGCDSMRICAQTPAACRKVGRKVAPQVGPLTIQARSQSRYVSYIRSQKMLSGYP